MLGRSRDVDAQPEVRRIRHAEDRRPRLDEVAARDQVLLERLHAVFRDAESRFSASLRTLFEGIGDTVGGLAQALSGHEEDDLDDYGLRVTQLKRALRGVAFARGALYPLRPAVTAELFDELARALGQLEQDVFHEIGRLRSQYREDDSSS